MEDLTGYWELEAYAEAPELCEDRGADTRPYVAGWLEDPAPPVPEDFRAISGFVLHIARGRHGHRVHHPPGGDAVVGQ
ncbi:hypothetical protein AB0I81_33460 [Nonomuraea sp. NPDC050404]|uniref:hypothetical protein n=1 Tax=Nonomuraea sp. NPDC050404 TaxID=3155783 RepID=UPI0033CC07B6